MEQSQQELMYKFSMFEQQIKYLQQQMEAVENAITDIASLNLNLDELKGKKGKEIMAQIGRGIYCKAILNSEELIVDIGEKNFVPKSIDETKNIMENQIKKLENIQKDLNDAMSNLNEELTKMFLESQKKTSAGSGKEKCSNPECVCEEDCEDDCKCN